MRCTDDSRRGMGAPTIMVLALPIVMLVGALARSYQASTTRRFASTVWNSYVASELAETAIAEAAHAVTYREIFDASLFGGGRATVDHGRNIASKMVEDALPGVPFDLKEYRRILHADGGEARSMLVGFRFPPRENIVPVPGLAKDLARNTTGVLLEEPEDLVVSVRPLAFRREYASGAGAWYHWGVLQLRVKVRIQTLRGVLQRALIVHRRFTLRFDAAPGQEDIVISNFNLYTRSSEVGG